MIEDLLFKILLALLIAPASTYPSNIELRDACGGGDLAACRRLGTRHLTGDGAKKDLERAAKYFALGCPSEGESRDVRACQQLGTMSLRGTGGQRDLPRAAALFQLACDGGDASGCAGLAQMYLRGIGGLEKDRKKAEELYAGSCRSGWIRSCRIMYERLDGRDLASAKEFKRLACELGDDELCEGPELPKK